ncbi:hypothetical protein HDU96_008254 [Phlyctochytrium bullatum]|nr:hypothetical protein HDU96_008254 [Phlyctochytrium bullatum]
MNMNSSSSSSSPNLTTVDGSYLDLCTQMPGMPGCKMGELCKANPSAFPSPYCTPLSLLSDICALDMPSMRGCKLHPTVCPKSSPPQDCAPLPSLPTSQQLATNIRGICTSMSMKGCDACPALVSDATTGYEDCDMLGTYASLCQQMPGMEQCGLFKQLCAGPAGGSALCVGGAGIPLAPQMKMYFHTGINDYVLFENWVPTTQAAYAAAIIGSLLLGVLFELWLLIVGFVDGTLAAKGIGSTVGEKTGTVPRVSKGKLVRSLVRGGMRMVTAFLAYILMLLAMTYNAGIFAAVIIGLGLGSMLFGGYEHPYTATSTGKNGGADLCC